MAYKDGIILIDKPSGMTSQKVVQIIKKKLGAKKVGHAGTLDPLATGVLIILVNKATKLSDFFLNKDKVYKVEASLFTETDSGDITGQVIKQENPKIIGRSELNYALNCFDDLTYWQTPPLYSAIKIKGRKLYEYARKGLQIDIPSRQVTIKSIKLLEYHEEKHTLSFTVECSKGTYIRSLVKDIAEKLGTIATLSQLCRISSGSFHVEQSIPLEKVERSQIIPLDIDKK